MKRSTGSSSSSTGSMLSFRSSSVDENQVESITSLVKGQLRSLIRDSHSHKPKSSILYCMTFMPEHGGMNNETVRLMFNEVVAKIEKDPEAGPYISAGARLVITIKEGEGGQLDAIISLKPPSQSKCSLM